MNKNISFLLCLITIKYLKIATLLKLANNFNQLNIILNYSKNPYLLK